MADPHDEPRQGPADGRALRQLSDEETRRVADQVQAALDRIEAEPKSMSWRLRAKVGDRKKWYRDMGELTAMPEDI